MERMQILLRKQLRESYASLESDPHHAVAFRCIGDALYSHNDADVSLFFLYFKNLCMSTIFSKDNWRSTRLQFDVKITVQQRVEIFHLVYFTSDNFYHPTLYTVSHVLLRKFVPHVPLIVTIVFLYGLVWELDSHWYIKNQSQISSGFLRNSMVPFPGPQNSAPFSIRHVV